MPEFSRTQKFTKANIVIVPQNKAIIYKIKSKDGENLYTGIAGQLYWREIRQRWKNRI